MNCQMINVREAIISIISYERLLSLTNDSSNECIPKVIVQCQFNCVLPDPQVPPGIDKS